MLRKGGVLSAFGITGEQDVMQVRPFEIRPGREEDHRFVRAASATTGRMRSPFWHIKRIDPKPLFSMKVPLEDLEWSLHELRRDPNLFKIFVSRSLPPGSSLGPFSSP